MLSGNDLEPQHCTTTYHLVATILLISWYLLLLKCLQGLLLPDSRQLVQLLR